MSTPPATNRFGQPIGPPLQGWTAPPAPAREGMVGRLCRLEPLSAERHADALFDADALDAEGRSWTYLAYGPFASRADYRRWVEELTAVDELRLFAIVRADLDAPVGVASYLRIFPEAGSIEIGHLHFSELLSRHPAATEAMFLMMRHAFALGYRRCEWKCDALNAASRAAATRLGFAYEGTFRQATVYNGRSRDTAWFSVIDREWPALEATFERWLRPENFDADGRQRTRLSEATRRADDAR